LEVEVVVRKWGNSLGLTLPKILVKEQEIKENEVITVDIQKEKPIKVKDIFGLLPEWKIDSQKLKDELRREDIERDKKISRLLRHH
jgi:antitoxin component of MazEF toxin-antitoxin module